MRLSASALGPLVDVRVPRHGVVHSVFARAVNLRVGAELWTVLGHEGNDAALTIRLAPGQDVGMVARRAGGSVHVYGTLRGRVVAGFTGNPRARVFCRRLEAELVAIDGVYRTADDMDAALRGKAVHAWLEGDSIVMTALD